jgi:hypothetical protein
MKKKSHFNEQYIKALTYLTRNGWDVDNTLISSGYGDGRLQVIKSRLIKDGKVIKEKQIKFNTYFLKEIHTSIINIYEWLISKD